VAAWDWTWLGSARSANACGPATGAAGGRGSVGVGRDGRERLGRWEAVRFLAMGTLAA
jgi:hypothetical protein